MPIFGSTPNELTLDRLTVREDAELGELRVVGFVINSEFGPVAVPGHVTCEGLTSDGQIYGRGEAGAAVDGPVAITGVISTGNNMKIGGDLTVDGDSDLAGVAVPGRLNQTIDGAPYALPASFEAVGPSDTLSNSASALTFTPGLNFPAGMMNAGAILEIESWGRVSSALVPGTARVIVRFGSGLGANLFGTSFVPLAASQSNAAWHYRARFRCTAAGAAGTINATCQEIYLPNTTQRPAPINGLAFNTTDTAILRTVFQFTTADAANSATMDGMIARLYRGPEA